jgi:transposase InsO family protein/transposase-like protein
MGGANPGGGRRYTADERKHGVARAAAIGPAAAGRELGIPMGTLTCWTHKAKKAAVVAPTIEPAETVAAEVPPSPVEPAPPEGQRRTKHVARLWTPSQKAEILEHAAVHGVTAASRKFGASRFSIYGWQRRVARAAAGEGPSPTSGPAPVDVEKQRDTEVLGEWKKHPGLGPSQIKNQLRRRGIKVSTNTVREIMIVAGYRPPNRKERPHDRRFEAVRPSQLWHLDFLHRHINRASTYSLILIDDYSRFVVGHGVDDAERAAIVIETFEAAVARHGKPEMVLHDKGSAFWSWRGISRFTELLTEMNVEQIAAENKETNGKIEVFNANLAKELFDVHRFYDVAEMRRRLAAHLHFYNHGRTSHALGGLLVPADRFFGRADEVLARIEAGLGRDLPGENVDLRDRRLELFEVTSQGGHVEIRLMGRKILEWRD